MFRFKEQRNIARLNFLCIEVYRETQSYIKDSKNHFGQFKENISEQSLPKNIFIIKKFKRFSFWMQIFFVNLVHSSKYFVLVLFTLSWMKRVTASLEFITVHSCLVTKSKILESELLNQTIIIVKNAAVKIDKLRLFY